MKLSDFEARARAAFEEIPEEYRAGIDGLVIRRDAPKHPTLPDIYTLGECLTEEHLSDFGGPDTTRSVIALYWGSFRALSQLNPDFDWDGEIWDTLTHELRHHLESLAGDDALEEVDYAADESFKRREGRDFDPWYYQYGDDLGGGVYDVEGDYYVEQVWDSGDYEAVDHLELTWREQRFRIEKPEELGDIHFVWAEELGGPVELVLVRKRSWWEDVRRLVTSRRPRVLESSVRASRFGEGT